MRAFRIADRRHPIFDGTGAMLHGGRWNTAGRPVIYAAETFAGALLEVLVHANTSRIPRYHAMIQIAIPDDVRVESVDSGALSGWNDPDQTISRAFGDEWLDGRRTAVMLVPSVVTDGRERNVIINPSHPDFRKIRAYEPEEVRWDKRLLRLSPP